MCLLQVKCARGIFGHGNRVLTSLAAVAEHRPHCSSAAAAVSDKPLGVIMLRLLLPVLLLLLLP